MPCCFQKNIDESDVSPNWLEKYLLSGFFSSEVIITLEVKLPVGTRLCLWEDSALAVTGILEVHQWLDMSPSPHSPHCLWQFSSKIINPYKPSGRNTKIFCSFLQFKCWIGCKYHNFSIPGVVEKSNFAIRWDLLPASKKWSCSCVFTQWKERAGSHVPREKALILLK